MLAFRNEICYSGAKVLDLKVKRSCGLSSEGEGRMIDAMPDGSGASEGRRRKLTIRYAGLILGVIAALLCNRR